MSTQQVISTAYAKSPNDHAHVYLAHRVFLTAWELASFSRYLRSFPLEINPVNH